MELALVAALATIGTLIVGLVARVLTPTFPRRSELPVLPSRPDGHARPRGEG
jgi:hypothetical protein